MSPIEIPFDELKKPANFKPGGQSPAVNPTATIQFIESLMPLLADPNILMASGIQLHELFKELIQKGPLKNNAKKIQIDRDEIAARLGGGANDSGAVVAPPGGASPAELPGVPADPGGAVPPVALPVG